MNDLHQTLLRSVLKVGAGALVAKGITDEGTAEIAIGGLLAVASILWGVFHCKAKPPGAALLLLGFTFLAGSGCARFTTTQTDLSYDDQGKPLRKITTQATASTLFEAKSALANFKASQTDKTQTASVGTLNQESTGTNAVDVAGAIVGAAIRAAVIK